MMVDAGLALLVDDDLFLRSPLKDEIGPDVGHVLRAAFEFDHLHGQSLVGNCLDQHVQRGLADEFARDESTALHNKFEWDDATASHEYRLEQARRIIRVFVRCYQEGKAPIRAYVSLMADRKEPGGGYRLLDDVLADATRRAALLEEALAELGEAGRKINDARLRDIAEYLDRRRSEFTSSADFAAEVRKTLRQELEFDAAQVRFERRQDLADTRHAVNILKQDVPGVGAVEKTRAWLVGGFTKGGEELNLDPRHISNAKRGELFNGVNQLWKQDWVRINYSLIMFIGIRERRE